LLAWWRLTEEDPDARRLKLRLVPPPLPLAAAPDDRRRRPGWTRAFGTTMPKSVAAARVGDRLRFRGDAAADDEDFESGASEGGEVLRGEVVRFDDDPAGVVVAASSSSSSLLASIAVVTGLRSWQAPHRLDRMGLAKVQRGHGHDDDAEPDDEHSGVDVWRLPGQASCATASLLLVSGETLGGGASSAPVFDVVVVVAVVVVVVAAASPSSLGWLLLLESGPSASSRSC
jgi:hypothetical protein